MHDSFQHRWIECQHLLIWLQILVAFEILILYVVLKADLLRIFKKSTIDLATHQELTDLLGKYFLELIFFFFILEVEAFSTYFLSWKLELWFLIGNKYINELLVLTINKSLNGLLVLRFSMVEVRLFLDSVEGVIVKFEYHLYYT